ncbi:hypothetical protein [Puia dinghuensis]|uniref:Carboxypeptidase regulatory-like domain-containing protein n=1 Tax=Puia dinghuensis TaxID=1792502 RepID=A0A8J2U9J7_9BACT|nr:hypothetical protein [Puia dinghuensis]GGA88607.1 hypothetical protein GCM10011511_09780 [Puia dinghuensis]
MAAINESPMEVTGEVLDRATNRGRNGLTVQAWDASNKITVALGKATTDSNGRFTIRIEYRQYNFPAPPDLYFKVYDADGKNLLGNTADYVIWNSKMQEDVTIYLYTQVQTVSGKDRLGARQALNIANFVQKSDFLGVFNEGKTTLSGTWGMVGDMVSNYIKNINLTPLKVNMSRNAVVNKDVATATSNLRAQNIQVNEVLPYRPSMDSSSLKMMTGAIPPLKSGQKVNLYEVNGTVKYYSVVTATTSATPVTNVPGNPLAPGAPIVHTDMKAMQTEISANRQALAQKDQQIAILLQELDAIRRDQSEIKALLKGKSST